MSGYYEKITRIKSDANPIDNKTKFAWDDDDYEEVEVWHEYTQEELNDLSKQQARQEQEELIRSLPDALADLSFEVSDNSISTTDLMDAIADLSTVVSNLSAKGESNG